MLILFAFKMVEMSDKNFTKAKLKEHILSVSKYSREILESKNVIFFCVCVAFVTICEQFVITVVSALTLNISQPETSKHLIDQEVSREFTRVWTHLKSAAAQTPRPQRGSAGLSGLEKVELAAITR